MLVIAKLVIFIHPVTYFFMSELTVLYLPESEVDPGKDPGYTTAEPDKVEQENTSRDEAGQ